MSHSFNQNESRATFRSAYRVLWYFSIAYLVYMPFHVFLSQSLSLVTGGLDIWKAAKDVLIALASPAILYVAYRRGIFAQTLYRRIFYASFAYALLHLLFVVFDNNDHTFSALTGSVFNIRLLVYLLLGFVIGSASQAVRYRKYIVTTIVLVAALVAALGIAQYFLPKDILTHVGYSIDRGVKPMFFIDDKPDFPRIMSTLRDPNSLGAFLILPIILSGLGFARSTYNAALFVRPFRRSVHIAMCAVMVTALLLTFSRGALLGLLLAVGIVGLLTLKSRLFSYAQRNAVLLAVGTVIGAVVIQQSWNTYTFQNLVFHADEATVLADPNELRVSLTQEVIDDVVSQPEGYGPGSAGLVSINNPQGTQLTENYYLQIGYEVGWLGLALFIAILAMVLHRLYVSAHTDVFSRALFAAGIALSAYALLIHLWSNEAVALQWWLLAGLASTWSARGST